ncbi:MAG: ATPase, partial [Actinobacteria bacterium]|nr:ATPase [Actinomycetota bacterium]
DDGPAQSDALRLLKVPVGAGYEQVIASLGRRPGGDRADTERDRAPRQFIFGDGAGGVERIRVDFSGAHLQHLCTALDTTPDALRGDLLSPELPRGPDLVSGERNSSARNGIGPAGAVRARA